LSSNNIELAVFGKSNNRDMSEFLHHSLYKYKLKLAEGNGVEVCRQQKWKEHVLG